MIETAELRLELLQIVKDKNGSEVDEIIHNADKLFDWVNYDPSKVEKDVEKDVVEEKPNKSATSLDEEDEKVIEDMILNNLLCFYKLQGSMDSPARQSIKLEYSVIPDYWTDDKKKFYKLLIDTINTRYVGNSGIKPVVKTPGDVILAKKLRDACGKKLEKVMEDYFNGKTKKVDDILTDEKVDDEVCPDFDSYNFKSKEDADKWVEKFLEEEKKRKTEKELIPNYTEEANKVADFYDMSESKFPVGAI